MINHYSEESYLAGSFHKFRDGIIAGAPSKKFADPKFNRQNAMYATNQDDLEAAISTPVIIVVLVNGKTPGTMTFVELGAAYESGSKVIVADERKYPNDALGKWLQNMTENHFHSIDEMTEFVENDLVMPTNYAPKIYPDMKDKVENVFFAGDLDHWLGYVADTAKKLRPEMNMYKKDDHDFGIFYETCMEKGDLVAVHFPQNIRIDRKTCFLMGGALYRKIPIIGKLDAVTPYPPLIGGLFRRTFNDHIGTLAYLLDVNVNDIGNESGVMYPMFPRDGHD